MRKKVKQNYKAENGSSSSSKLKLWKSNFSEIFLNWAICEPMTYVSYFWFFLIYLILRDQKIVIVHFTFVCSMRVSRLKSNLFEQVDFPGILFPAAKSQETNQWTSHWLKNTYTHSNFICKYKLFKRSKLIEFGSIEHIKIKYRIFQLTASLVCESILMQ